MKATYRTSDGRISFEVEGESAKALFAQIAGIQEIFDVEHECGMCKSKDIRFRVRKADKFTYYELNCQECRARLDFGQSQDLVSLFPKRKDEDGRWMEHRGWYRYEPQSASQPVPPAKEPLKAKAAFGQSGPRSVAAPTGPTPEGLQPSFDRLGVLFNVPAPTRIGSALDLIRDQMHMTAGNAGTNQFDQIYRKFEADAGAKTDAGKLKALLRDLMGALDKLRLEVA